MDNSILKKVYDIIKRESKVNGFMYGSLSKEKKTEFIEGLKGGNWEVVLTEKCFPSGFSIKFEDLPNALKELSSPEHPLIKFDGNWSNAIVTNPSTKIREKVDAFRVYLLEIVDSDKEFRIKKSKKGGVININANNWNEVEIRFLDKFTIEVLVAGKPTHKCSYIDLGFYVGTKQKKPDEAWNFLESLSVLQGENGMDATKQLICDSLSKPGKKITKNNCEQIAKKLSNKLNDSLGMKSNPLNSYKGLGRYKPIFTLKPIPNMRKWHEEPFITPHKNLNEEFGYGKGEDNGFNASEEDEPLPLPEDEA